MTRFRYEALDRNSLTVAGELDAADGDAAVKRLLEQGLRVVSLEAAPAENEAEQGEKTERGEESITLQPREFYDVTAHIAEVTSANLPLAPGLHALASELPAGRVQAGLHAIAAELERGVDLADVMQSRGAPSDLVALLRAGGRTGRLGDFLSEFMVHYRKTRILKRRTWLGLLYPLLLLGGGAFVILFATLWIIPLYKRIFLDFGVELPGITLLAIALSDWTIAFRIHLLFVLVLLGGAIWFGRRRLAQSIAWRSFWLKIPLIGTAFRGPTLAWFNHLLALLTENNVPLPEALLLAGDSAGDVVLQEACRQLVASSAARGEPFALVAHEIPLFPAMFVQALAAERERGSLPEVFRIVAKIYERQSQQRSLLLTVILTPFIWTVFIVGVGLFVLAIFMPLVKLLNQLT